MASYDELALAVACFAPGNEVLFDDLGKPSVMVKIPKMTYAQLGMGSSTAVHPAFIVNGQEVDEIFISKYQNIVKNSRAYSLPGQEPRGSITFDDARAACEAKGEGWHLMTRMEWGLIVRWCQNNGVLPKANNNYGKHVSETNYKAIPMTKDGSGQTLHTATGTGPLTWFHDQTPSGIADMGGNVREWSGGIRCVYGELQILPNNNAADSDNSQAASSAQWKAIDAATGDLITPNGSGTTAGSVKMDWVSSKLTYSTSKTHDTGSGSDAYSSATFANIVCDATIGAATKLLLQDLGMLMYGSDPELFSGLYASFNNHEAERMFYSGSYYGSSSYGLASFRGYNSRSNSYATLGFRSAFVHLPSV